MDLLKRRVERSHDVPWLLVNTRFLYVKHDADRTHRDVAEEAAPRYQTIRVPETECSLPAWWIYFTNTSSHPSLLSMLKHLLKIEDPIRYSD